MATCYTSALMGLSLLMLIAFAIKPDPKHLAAIAEATALNASPLYHPMELQTVCLLRARTTRRELDVTAPHKHAPGSDPPSPKGTKVSHEWPSESFWSNVLPGGAIETVL